MRIVANIHKFLVIGLVVLSACTGQDTVDSQEPAAQDSVVNVELIEPGKLVVLMSNNISGYYILKGQPRGFEYELLKAFCKDHELELVVKVENNFEYLLDSLVAGVADLAAGNITVTGERKEKVHFLPEVLRTRMVLVQRLPDNYRKLSRKQRKARMVQDALDLDGRVVWLSSGSSYVPRLEHFVDENGLDVTLHKVPGDISTAELMQQVADGDIDFTIVDENVAKIHQSNMSNIDISVPLSLSQNIAWAIPKGNHDLDELLSNWIIGKRGSAKFNVIFNKYFGSKSHLRNHANYTSIQNGKISAYDETIKKYAEYINWDWRLLAAMINKESKFNPNVESSFGAVGLMQVMPVTANRFGVDTAMLRNPELNIQAGTRFVQWLENFWLKRLEDTTQLQFYILASYNAGPGHVLDAMYLAEKYELDPQIWHENVEVMLLNKSKPQYYKDPVSKRGYCNGLQPVNYVSQVMAYYAFYKTFDESHQAKEEEPIIASN